jgi:hypothetical protein
VTSTISDSFADDSFSELGLLACGFDFAADLGLVLDFAMGR